MTTRVAVLTASCMIAGSADERGDSFEHRLQMQAWQPACEAIGIELIEVIWNDPTWQAADFDAVVIATPWDYPEQPAAFLDKLAEIEKQTLLCNSLDCVRWNLDKAYLAELSRAGVAVVPTLWIDAVNEPALAKARDLWPGQALVVKPQVGAGGWRQVKIEVDQALPAAQELPPDRAMIQPFLPAAVEEGEISLVYCGGEFSHALRKSPAPGDYRVQAIFGGREQTIHADTEMQRVAEQVLSQVPFDLMYARIDLMRGLDGAFALMELELIEPYLYPEQADLLGPHWAAALAKQLERGKWANPVS